MRLSFKLQVLFSTAVFAQFIHTCCMAQTPVLLNSSTALQRLDTHVEVFIDSSDRISIEEIVKPDFQHRFLPSQGKLTFGYLKSPLWLKLVTRTASPETDWYLEIPAPFLEYVDFYQLESGDIWSHSVSGYYMPHSARKISHTGHVLPLQFREDSTSTVYVRISGVSPKTFPLYAIEKEKFIEKNRLNDLGYGIFFGILIVMFFYNLFIYLILKQRNYLLYFCTIVCTFLIFSAVSGYGGKFLWPENPILNYYTGKMSLEVMVIFLSVFTMQFLEVRRYSTVMYYIVL